MEFSLLIRQLSVIAKWLQLHHLLKRQFHKLHQLHHLIKEAVSLDCAESFLLKRGGRVLENVQRHKVRNTLSKIVGGKCITEDEVLEKIIDHENKHQKMNKQTEKSINECQNKTKKSKTFAPKPSTSGTKSKKRRIEYSEDFSSSENESDVDESSKCIICKRFSPDSSKRPDIIIVKWGQCDTCLGWVHLGFALM